MSQRHIDIISAGCSACTDTIDLVNSMVCGSCAVEVLDMQRPEVAARARDLGVGAVPAVVIDGELAGRCGSRGVDEATLRAAGVGSPRA